MTRKEAIKIVKEFINGTCLHMVGREALETLIPELRESEDERTRKEIICFIEYEEARGNIPDKWYQAKRPGVWISYLEKQKESEEELSESEDERIRKAIVKSIEEDSSVYEQEISKESMLAWLKKQKEQKSRIDACGFPLRDEGESACSYLERCLSPDMRNIWYEACSEIKEKQQEQKLVDDNQIFLKGLMRVRDDKTLTEWEKQFDNIADKYAHNKNKEGYNQSWYTKERAAEMLHFAKKELEQKPTECIKTEELAKYIKAEFESFRNLLKKKGIDYQPAETYWTDFARLFVSSAKKLQKPAEWSEQNKKWFDAIIKDYEESLSGDEEHDPAIQIKINLLKSLHPSWKPNEEQIKALKYAAYHMLPGEEYRDILFSLLKDLTKLM